MSGSTHWNDLQPQHTKIIALCIYMMVLLYRMRIDFKMPRLGLLKKEGLIIIMSRIL